ncbi:MAG: hypothetical protein K6D37_03185 [Prevotella sp.]|nr:hypothetical protein [Prevotella sp.]
MKKETYEAQKAFAGEKKPSMQRRCVGHDYSSRQIYMITMVTEGRRPLFGQIAGRSDAPEGCPDAPRLVLSDLGEAEKECWHEIERRHPHVCSLALQLMPDHLHGILFVKEKMEVPLGKVLLGFKHGCNKAFRQLVPSVAVLQQQTERSHGFLFAPGYNDRLLLRRGQLDAWRHYLADNPRRLLMKREHPDLFRVQRNLQAFGFTFSAIGNRFLLQYPHRIQVQCSRRLTETDVHSLTEQTLAIARQGAVLVSPSISPGEKAILRAAFNEHLPLIFLQENGLTGLAKPGGKRMEACARGQLLILAPWEQHNEKMVISRSQCLSLNEMARRICESN